MNARHSDQRGRAALSIRLIATFHCYLCKKPNGKRLGSKGVKISSFFFNQFNTCSGRSPLQVGARGDRKKRNPLKGVVLYPMSKGSSVLLSSLVPRPDALPCHGACQIRW